MPTIIAIVIAVIAVAVAIGAWFRPPPKPEIAAAKTYSEQEVTDAKQKICDAFATVQSTLEASSNQAPPDPNDVMQKFTLSVNGRLASYAGVIICIARLRKTLQRLLNWRKQSENWPRPMNEPLSLR